MQQQEQAGIDTSKQLQEPDNTMDSLQSEQPPIVSTETSSANVSDNSEYNFRKLSV